MNNECSNCGHFNSNDATKCENCGANLVEILDEESNKMQNSAGEEIERGERFIFGLSLYSFLVFPFFLTLFWKDLGMSLTTFRTVDFAVLPCLGLFILVLGKIVYPKSKMFMRLLLFYAFLIAFLCLIYFGFGIGKVK